MDQKRWNERREEKKNKRDSYSQNRVIGQQIRKSRFQKIAAETEAKAAENGTIFAWELGLRDIILEGDSRVIMNVLGNPGPAPVQV